MVPVAGTASGPAQFDPVPVLAAGVGAVLEPASLEPPSDAFDSPLPSPLLSPLSPAPEDFRA